MALFTITIMQWENGTGVKMEFKQPRGGPVKLATAAHMVDSNGAGKSAACYHSTN